MTWIGDRDLEVAVGKRQRGPIANLLLQRPAPIERIMVLHETSDAPADLSAFRRWLDGKVGCDICYHAVAPIDDAHAYSQLYPVVREFVQEALDHLPDQLVLLNGSSGRPVKHAIFMLLATPNPRLRLLSAWSDRRPVATLDLPFSVAVDFARTTTAKAFRDFLVSRSLTDEEAAAFSDVHGSSQSISDARVRAASFAAHDVPILICGETGTGKELFAQAIHDASTRSRERFVPVNCGAIPEALIDAELFGAKKGAFTGADRDRKGLFQQADKGTLFLDEIGELPLHSQARLLRALNSTPCRIRPVGATDEEQVNVRIVAATHRDLPRMVRDGRFREDLWYRLSAAVVELPPLRARAEDIDLLIDLFWNELLSKSSSFLAKTLSPAALKVLRNHTWPGNARELRATLLRLAISARSTAVTASEARSALKQAVSLPDQPGILDRSITSGQFDIGEVVDEVRRHYLKRALTISGGNKSEAARLLGLGNHSVINSWMERLMSEHD